jgi:hypothetical protein
MTRHDDTETRVSTWLHDEAQGELPDWALQETFERTRAEPQQRGLRGRLAAITQPNGSSTRGRSNMFSFAKLTAVVGATALATTAILSVSLAPNDPVAPPGAEVDPAAPVEFTGRTSFGTCFGSSAYETGANGLTMERNEGRYCNNPNSGSFTDQRLQGDFRVWQNNDQYTDGPAIWATSFSMHDDDGAWVQRPSYALFHPDDSGPARVITMDGQGAYEGIAIVAEVNIGSQGWTWHGYIIDGELPPHPQIELPE